MKALIPMIFVCMSIPGLASAVETVTRAEFSQECAPAAARAALQSMMKPGAYKDASAGWVKVPAVTLQELESGVSLQDVRLKDFGRLNPDVPGEKSYSFIVKMESARGVYDYVVELLPPRWITLSSSRERVVGCEVPNDNFIQLETIR